MAYGMVNFPTLTSANLRSARLFADRKDMMRNMPGLAGGVFAELGVALGDFSEFLMDEFNPSEFVALDLFNMHTYPGHWGRTSAEMFKGLTQREYYEARFANRGGRVVTEEGNGSESLARYPDEHFDMIYIDAGHTYHEVMRDLTVARCKVKANGLLVFNDYIMFDHMAGIEYGVVQAVNEFVTETNWPIVGFALQHHMYCDIAVRCGPLD